MIVNRKLQKKTSKKYMRLACLYRSAMRGSSLVFDEDALLECYNYESKGGVISANNGFYAGKRFMDVTVQDAIKEIQDGNFCKAEFYTPLRGWYWRKRLENVIVGPLFIFKRDSDKQTDECKERAL